MMQSIAEPYMYMAWLAASSCVLFQNTLSVIVADDIRLIAFGASNTRLPRKKKRLDGGLLPIWTAGKSLNVQLMMLRSLICPSVKIAALSFVRRSWSLADP